MSSHSKLEPKKILLGQLGRRGDCLYATAVAKQIKHDFPGCHLTWAISSMCRSVIENNPYIDEVWEVKQDNNNEVFSAWYSFESEVTERKLRGEFDEVFLTQVHPGNFQNYDGTSRSSLFRGYPGPITVPVEPVVRLTDQEVNRVERFINKNNVSIADKAILFECASTSGQSFVTQSFAIETAKYLISVFDDIKIILSSDQSLNQELPENIIDASQLSFRENAELTKYCTLLVGCSSGISWLATSDWAKPLPKIQLLSAETHMYASMVHDAKHFGLSTENIIEMQECTARHLADCIQIFLNEGWKQAKKNYHVEIPVAFSFYLRQLHHELLSKGEILKSLQALSFAIDRYKYDPIAVEEIRSIRDKFLLPFVDVCWKDLSSDDKAGIRSLLDYKEKDHLNTLLLIRCLFSLSSKAVANKYSWFARSLLKCILKGEKTKNGNAYA